MDLNALMTSDEIISRKIKLGDGNEHELFFKELPAVEFRKFYIAERSDSEDTRANSMIRLVVASLVNPDGTQALTEREALKLKSNAMNEITKAIMDINGFGDAVKKD